MAEKGRHSNGAIGSPLEVGSATTKCHFSSLPPDRPRSPLDYRKGGPPNVSQETTGRALRSGAMYPHAGGDEPLIAPFRGRTDGSGQAKADILLEPVRRASGPATPRGHGG